MPGFGPAAELVAWRVPKGATFVVEEKNPKPLTPHPASLNGTDAHLRRADQLAALRQGPPNNKSVHPWAGRQASSRKRKNLSGFREIHVAL